MKYASVWRDDWDQSASGSNIPPIDDRLPTLPDQEAELLLRFLEGGHIVLRTTARIPDPLMEGSIPRIGISTRTDGEWAWDDSLIYFVRHHRISPPAEFMEYVRGRDFQLRTPTAEELVAARRELLG